MTYIANPKVASVIGPAIAEPVPTTCYRLEHWFNFECEHVKNDCNNVEWQPIPEHPSHNFGWKSPWDNGIPHPHEFYLLSDERIYRRHTPIGDLDDIIHITLQDGGWPGYRTNLSGATPYCYPPGDKFNYTVFEDYHPERYSNQQLLSECLFYTKKVMIQFYFHHRSYMNYELLGTSIPKSLLGTPYTGDGSGWVGTYACIQTGSFDPPEVWYNVAADNPTRYSEVAVAINYDEISAYNIDPLDQDRISILEDKLEEMMDLAGEEAPEKETDESYGYPGQVIMYKRCVNEMNVQVVIYSSSSKSSLSSSSSSSLSSSSFSFFSVSSSSYSSSSKSSSSSSSKSSSSSSTSSSSSISSSSSSSSISSSSSSSISSSSSSRSFSSSSKSSSSSQSSSSSVG